jgi:hypothetical protein
VPYRKLTWELIVTDVYTQRIHTKASTQREGAKNAKVAKKCKRKMKVWENSDGP